MVDVGGSEVEVADVVEVAEVVVVTRNKNKVKSITILIICLVKFRHAA